MYGWAGIVTEDGYIRKCFDSVVEGVTIADLLKDCFLNPDSEHADLFSDSDRNEFIYELFKHVVTGGGMCQYDDDWHQYLNVTKA